jgi:hypothetical protein
MWLPFLNTYRTMCLAPEPVFAGFSEKSIILTPVGFAAFVRCAENGRF